MSATATQGKTPLAARADSPPMARNLSASGSRKAPERVVPSRRASQPSRPSVQARMIQPAVADHDTPSTAMSRSSGIVRAKRATVTRLAGVRRALGPKRERRVTGWVPMSGHLRHEVGADGRDDPGAHHGPRRAGAPEADDAVDLRRLPVRAPDGGAVLLFVHEDFDPATDEGVTGGL